MAARKNKKSKSKKKTPAKKMPLWLRDILNILGGGLVGILGFWLIQEYMENRDAKQTAQKYGTVIRESLPHLKPMAEQYLALSGEGSDKTVALENLDLSRPIYPLDPFRGLPDEVCSLSPEVVPSVLAFARNLQKAELLRKILEQLEADPGQLSQTLSSQLLRTVSEEEKLGTDLIWKMKLPPGGEEQK
jgi:hypothetical protein